MFASLLSSRDDGPDDKASPAPQRHVFSFDALGVLGFGASKARPETAPQVTTDAVQPPAPQAMRPGRMAPLAVMLSEKGRDMAAPVVSATPASRASTAPSAPMPEARAKTAATIIFTVPADNDSVADRIDNIPTPTMPTATKVDDMESVPHPAVTPETSPGLDMALAEPIAVPRLSGGIARTASQTSVAPALPASEWTSAVRVPVTNAVAVPEAAPRAAAAGVRHVTATDIQPGRTASDISIAVSESDGTVHVLAAASGLGEDARMKLRGLVQMIAWDAGLALGEFSLNGAALPDFPYLVRSPSWPYHR